MEGGASDWGKLCARREAQCRPMLEQDYNQSKTTNWVKPFVNCSKKFCQHPWAFGIQICHAMTTFHFSSRLMEMHPKTEFSSYFLCTVNIQSIDRGIQYTYNLAHMVRTNRMTLSHLKGVQVGRSPHKEYELWTLNPWITKQTNKWKYKGKLK